MPESSHSMFLQGCLDRLRSGDESARQKLLTHANERLARMARKMLRGDPRVRRFEETDDVRQNAMLRLYRALEKIHPSTVRDFFRLAALQIRRELIDLARHHYGPEGLGGNVADLGADGPSDPGETTNEPQRLAVWTEFHERIESLGEENRELFDLLWYNEVPQAEAAALLNISERTLQRRWRAARQLLHRALHGEAPGM